LNTLLPVLAAGLLFVSVNCTTGMPRGQKIVRFDNSEIDESSGLARSRQFRDVLWTLNDSGDTARIFAVTHSGHELAEIQVLGAVNVDWETFAIDDSGHLWIGDVGNNLNNRRDLTVYRIPEPNPRASSRQVEADRVIHVRYPDQTGFPDPANMNFDAEALFFTRGHLYLLTKHRSDHRSALYRFPSLESGDVVLERLSDFDTVDSMVTGADTTPDGKYLAIISYYRMYIFERPADSDDYLANPPVKVIRFANKVTQQCESVAWEGDSLIFTNEQMEIHRIDHVFSPEVTQYP